jgi:hypothetical protein
MDNLFEQERIARMDGDLTKLEQIHIEIVQSCSNEDEVILSLRALINKRKQDQDSIKKVIKMISSNNNNVDFLKNLLIKVIEGRIYLEEERMEIAGKIKLIYGNDIKNSFEILKEVPVETFTTITETKRSHFLFEQIRLAILLKNYEEAEQFVRKVRKGYLNREDKMIFLNYSILLRIGQRQYLEVSKLFIELNEIDENKRHITLGSLYCIMSTRSEMKDKKKNDLNSVKKELKKEEKSNVADIVDSFDAKADLLMKFYEFKNNDESMRTHLKAFCSDLIIDFQVIDLIGQCVKRYEEVDFDKELLGRSILEHNFRVISKFFAKIGIDQAVSILKISENDLIDFVSEMVNEKYSTSKINQKDKIISFENKTWNNDVSNVLDKLISASYLIHKDTL